MWARGWLDRSGEQVHLVMAKAALGSVRMEADWEYAVAPYMEDCGEWVVSELHYAPSTYRENVLSIADVARGTALGSPPL